MAQDGIITRQELITDAALYWGDDYVLNLEKAKKAQEELKASARELNAVVGAYRTDTATNQNLIENKRKEKAATDAIIVSLREQEAVIASLKAQIANLTAEQRINNEVSRDKSRIANEAKQAIEAEKLSHLSNTNALKEETNAVIASEKVKQEKIKTEKLEAQQAAQVERATRAQKDAYGEMSAELNKSFRATASVAVELYRLREAGKANTPEFVDLTKRFGELRTETLKLDTELKKIDASLGRNQRNVGKYKFDALGNSIQQILREAPSAAVSLNTFFLAISNNLPAFFDSLTTIKSELAEIKKVAEDYTASVATQTEAQQAAVQVSSDLEESLATQVESVIASIGASREQAAAIREEVLAHLEEIETTGVATTETVANTEATLLNAGATVEQVAAIQGEIAATGRANISRAAATASLTAETLAATEANAALAAQPSILARVGSSLLSVNTFLTLGVVGLTFFGGQIIELLGTLGDFDEALTAVGRAQQKLLNTSNDAQKDFQKQADNLRQLQGIAKNEALSTDARNEAVKKLRQQYFYYYKDLSNAQILNKSYSKSEQELLKAIDARTKALSKQKEVDNIKDRIIDINDEIKAREGFAAPLAKLRTELSELQKIDGVNLNLTKEQIDANIARRKEISTEIKEILRQQGQRQLYNEELEETDKKQKAINESSLKQLKDEANGLQKLVKPAQEEVNQLQAESILLDAKEEKSKKDKYKTIKDEENALSDLIIFRLNLVREQNDAIVADENQTEEERYDAVLRSSRLQLAIAEEETVKKLRNISQYNDKVRDLTDEEIQILSKGGQIKRALNNQELLAVEELQKKRDDINRAGEKRYDDLLVSLFEKRLQRQDEANTKLLNDDLIRENKRFSNEEVGFKDREAAVEAHERNIFDIKKGYAIRALETQVASFKELLSRTDLTDKERLDYAAKLSNAEIALSDAKTATELKNLVSTRDANIAAAQFILETSQNLSNELGNLANTLFERRISKIDDEIQDIQNYYDEQTRLAGDDEEKKKLIEEESAKRTAQLERKKREEQRKQAIFNKAFNVAQVLQQTALAVISTLAQVPKFDFAISATTLAAIAAGVGAAQLANVLATPIPKYKHGRTGGIEEMAIVGDGGVQEIIEGKDGKIRVTPNVPTLTLLKQGDSVHSSKQAYRDYMSKNMFYNLNNDNRRIQGFNERDKSINNDKLKQDIQDSITDGFKKAKIINQIKTHKFDLNHELWAMNNKRW